MSTELNIDDFSALTAYLRRAGRIDPGEQPRMQILSGGVSNRTVLVRRADGEAWVLKQALDKLRVEVDWFSSPERSRREASGLRWLAKLAPPGAIPRLIFEDAAHHLLAMQAVAEPHVNWKTLLMAGRINQPHVTQFGELLGTIHRAAHERQAELATEIADRSYFETLRIEPYYAYTAAQVAGAAPFLESLIAETRRQRLTLVHGDYSPKNILVHHDHLVLLDQEVIHWGDPAFDLGFSLSHFLSKGHVLPAHRPAFAVAALRYRDAYFSQLATVPWVADLEPRWVRHALGCLLARVRGRSKLEYLDEPRQDRQQRIVVGLMTAPPSTIFELVSRFNERLDAREL